MCNLYTVRKSAAEVAAHFGVSDPIASNAPEEIYPGYPGLVVRELDGVRLMQSMVWGFPLRLKGMSPTAKPKPVNNIADLAKPMWKALPRQPQWRCLIPVTHFAEAEGPKGAKTRTWFSVKDQPIFAWAGLWRISDEWGPVYSGVMTDCNEAIRPIHDRMPVLLHADEHDQWLHGSFDDALAFQNRCFPDDLIDMERTSELWLKQAPKVAADPRAYPVMNPEQFRYAEALVIERLHGDRAPLFVAERIGALALAGDFAGVRRMSEIASKLDSLIAAQRRSIASA